MKSASLCSAAVGSVVDRWGNELNGATLSLMPKSVELRAQGVEQHRIGTDEWQQRSPLRSFNMHGSQSRRCSISGAYPEAFSCSLKNKAEKLPGYPASQRGFVIPEAEIGYSQALWSDLRKDS